MMPRASAHRIRPLLQSCNTALLRAERYPKLPAGGDRPRALQRPGICPLVELRQIKGVVKDDYCKYLSTYRLRASS